MILFCKVFKPPAAINSRFHIPLDCLNFALLRLNETINVTSHQLKKKKKIRLLVPTCFPPNPTTHHTIHSLFSFFGRSLSLLFSFSFSFSVNTTHIHTLLSLTVPPVHSSSSHLPFFSAKSLENPQEHHTFT